jgi:hypothetical protein
MLYLIENFLDARASSVPVRLLAYAQVPGISIESLSFHKAVAIIAKQQTAMQLPASASCVVDSPAAQASFSKGKKKHQAGRSPSLSFVFTNLLLGQFIRTFDEIPSWFR